MAYRDDDEDELDERDDPDESDMDEDDEPELVPCPYCRAQISEEAEVCPRCGSYISEEDAPRRKPTWVVIVALVLLATVFLVWVVMG